MIQIDMAMPIGCDTCPFCLPDFTCGNYSCVAYNMDVGEYEDCRHPKCNLHKSDKETADMKAIYADIKEMQRKVLDTAESPTSAGFYISTGLSMALGIIDTHTKGESE